MADFTKPAEIAGIQEANTYVYPESNLNNQLLQATQLRYAHKQAAIDREQKKQAEINKNFDFNTSEVWQQDIPEINDDIKAFTNKYREINLKYGSALVLIRE